MFSFFLKEFFYSLFCHPLSYTTNNKTTSNNNINWNNRELFFYKKIRAADIWKNILQKYIRDAIIVSFSSSCTSWWNLFLTQIPSLFFSLKREQKLILISFSWHPSSFSLCLCFTHNIWEEEQIPKTISEETPQKHKQSLQVPSKEIYYSFCVDFLFSLEDQFFCFWPNSPTTSVQHKRRRHNTITKLSPHSLCFCDCPFLWAKRSQKWKEKNVIDILICFFSFL